MAHAGSDASLDRAEKDKKSPAPARPSKSESKKKLDLGALAAAKANLNMVIVGHVDAGKSTLTGHLLVLLGEVNDKTIKRYQRDSEKIGKGSFAYAWVLDETEEERNRWVVFAGSVWEIETFSIGE